eukprot:3530243-Alexandrium_andersonii.AAC.1
MRLKSKTIAASLKTKPRSSATRPVKAARAAAAASGRAAVRQASSKPLADGTGLSAGETARLPMAAWGTDGRPFGTTRSPPLPSCVRNPARAHARPMPARQDERP